jgi:hypothetical protein
MMRLDDVLRLRKVLQTTIRELNRIEGRPDQGQTFDKLCDLWEAASAALRLIESAEVKLP